MTVKPTEDTVTATSNSFCFHHHLMASHNPAIHLTALSEFPWQNGLSLHAGLIANKFSEWVQQQNLDNEDSEKEVGLTEGRDQKSQLYQVDLGLLLVCLALLSFLPYLSQSDIN